MKKEHANDNHDDVIYFKSSQGLILLSTATQVVDKVRQNAIDCVNEVLAEFETIFNLRGKS